MFETIDNVTMVKESTGDLSGMTRIESLSDPRLPFYKRQQSPGLGRAAGGCHGMVNSRAVSATAALHRPV
jgi:4-hydroxy-tetrahydrodipicolinate synthase